MSLYEVSGFAAQEGKTHRAMRSGIDRARNRSLLDERRATIIPDDFPLHATGHSARLLWGKAFCKGIEEHFDLDGALNPSEPLYFFTLVDVGSIRQIDSPYMRPTELRNSFRLGMRGLNYIGMFEPAYYTNLSRGPSWQYRKCISWHVHGLIWGSDLKSLKARFAALNREGVYIAVAPILAGADVRSIKPGTLGKVIAYILKTPRKVYRLQRSAYSASGLNQKTSNPRPGEWVTLNCALRHFTLDQLSFSGGAGTSLLARIKRSAKQNNR